MELNRAQAKIITVLEEIYRNCSNTEQIFCNADKFDSCILKWMWNDALIDYDMSNTRVTLTEKGLGVLFFGESDAGKILKYPV
jgi:hypothetical protein